jgi:curved DNA-binding protein CbpA
MNGSKIRLLLLVVHALLQGLGGTDALKIRESPLYDDEKKKKRKPLFVSSLFYDADTLVEQEEADVATGKLDILYNLFNDNFIMRPPRDLWEGFVDALNNIQQGCWHGVCQIVDAGWEGYEVLGVPGLLGGGVYGLAKGALLATGGVAAGLYQLIQGMSNTPAAMKESNRGKTWEDGKWEYYSLDIEDKLLDQEVALSTSDDTKRSRQLRQRSKRKVKEKEYYHLLKVSTDASSSDIKRAYYREALHTHPDKNTEDSRASEKFQRLSSAYRVLSNEETRDAYDSLGKCGVPDQEITQIDSYTFFAVMFGSYRVEPYVGELKIASLVDSFLQLTDTHKLNKEADAFIDKESSLKQRRRVLDISLHLRDRLAKYVSGSHSEVNLRTSAKLEAIAIADGDFGDSFLISIGRSLMVEGKKFLGKHTSVFGIHGAAASIQATTSDMVESYQTLVALFQSVTSSVGPVMEAFIADSKRQKEEALKEPSTCDAKQTKMETLILIEKLEKTIPKALRLVWQLNDRDIRQTLKEATEKLLSDKATYEDRLARAKGLMILGREFYDMGISRKRKDRWQDSEGLKRSMGSAFEAAMRAEVGLD